MKAMLTLSDVDQIDVTLEITMSFGEWKDLQMQLTTNYPSSRLSLVIDQAIFKLTSRVHTDTEKVDV